MTKIIFFNGPPRSGKDTAALHTIEKFNFLPTVDKDWRARKVQTVHFDRFAMPIKLAFAACVGVSADKYGVVEPYESTKEDIIPWLGVSYRQWQIDFSEKFMKPFYGKNIFSQLFVTRNKDRPGLIVVPDSGFLEEVGPVAENFGSSNVLLVRIHRPGFTFAGDSRSYITGVGDIEYDVHNDSTQENFEKKIEAIVSDFIS